MSRVLAPLLLLPALCWAAPPVVSLPAEVKGAPGELIQVPSDTPGKSVRWVALDAGLSLIPAELLKDSHTAVVSAARAGRYRLLAYTAADDEPSAPALTVVVVGEAPPTPPPPPPPPPPVAKTCWVVVVEETADAAATRGTYFADKNLRAYLTARQWHWRAADKDVVDRTGRPPADLKPYLDMAKGKALPLYWVVDEAGRVRSSGPLPATPADLLQALKSIGGD